MGYMMGSCRAEVVIILHPWESLYTFRTAFCCHIISLHIHHVQRHRSDDSSRKVRPFSTSAQAASNTCCSGTSGYVVRNLSTLRSYQHTTQDRDAAWDAAPPKHREPDQGILEHERKRTVEVKCLELQVKLEDDEYVVHVLYSFERTDTVQG